MQYMKTRIPKNIKIRIRKSVSQWTRSATALTPLPSLSSPPSPPHISQLSDEVTPASLVLTDEVTPA